MQMSFMILKSNQHVRIQLCFDSFRGLRFSSECESGRTTSIHDRLHKPILVSDVITTVQFRVAKLR